MSNINREAISDLVLEGIDRVHDIDVTHDAYAWSAADSIIAALPDIVRGMVKPLLWEEGEGINRNDYHGSPYTVTKYISRCRKYTMSCNWQTGGSWDVTTGTWHMRLRTHLAPVAGATCVTLDEAKAAANAHHIAQVMAALDLTAQEAGE